MDKCWANPRGGCGDKISREHLISKGIFENREFHVKGFSWYKREFVKVGIEAITRKCLCTNHNNALSEIDNEGIKLFNVLDQIASFTVGTNHDKQLQINEKISGNLLERWFLKTLINFSYNSEYQLGQFGEINGRPHLYLVDVVFGTVSFSHYLGLYSLIPEGYVSISTGEITFTPLIQNAITIGGGIFSFRGIDFFLSLTPSIPPYKLGYLDVQYLPKHISDAVLIYRCPKMEWSLNGKQYHRIEIVW